MPITSGGGGDGGSGEGAGAEGGGGESGGGDGGGGDGEGGGGDGGGDGGGGGLNHGGVGDGDPIFRVASPDVVPPSLTQPGVRALNAPPAAPAQAAAPIPIVSWPPK